MKKCFKCLEEKSLAEFYKHKEMADGHLNKCKQCTKSDVFIYRINNLDKVQVYDKARAMAPERVLARKLYACTEAGKKSILNSTRRYRRDNPNKYKAHGIVQRAIRGNKLFKEPCQICGGKNNVHAHHDDYSKPLNVRWLCCHHHLEWHKVNGEGLNP